MENETTSNETPDESTRALVGRTTQNAALSPTYGPYFQTLPTTRKLPRDSIAAVDASEGIHPTAAERVNANPRKSVYELLLLFGSAAVFVVVLGVTFPWKYFLKPSLHEIALGPQTQSITDDDVKKMGGIEKLSPVQLAVHEVSRLRDDGRLHAARDKCADYISKIHGTSEHTTWFPIWRHYLEVLDRLKQTDALVAECARLREMVPDAPEATYYPAKLAVETVPHRTAYKKDKRRRYEDILSLRLRECQIAEATLSERKNDPAAQTMLNGFRLLIADIYRRQWWLSECSWEDDSRESAFKYLRKLPVDSQQAGEMKLSLLRDCNEHWHRWWRNDPPTRVIDGRSITPKNLAEEIQRLE
jgi:hypothetical protein